MLHLIAEPARLTDDIDVVLELAHYGKYAALQEKLIHAGFSPDRASKVICRYKYKGITVDIMPDDPGILGFKLVEKGKEHFIQTNKTLRAKERRPVFFFDSVFQYVF